MYHIYIDRRYGGRAEHLLVDKVRVRVRARARARARARVRVSTCSSARSRPTLPEPA